MRLDVGEGAHALGLTGLRVTIWLISSLPMLERGGYSRSAQNLAVSLQNGLGGHPTHGNHRRRRGRDGRSAVRLGVDFWDHQGSLFPRMPVSHDSPLGRYFVAAFLLQNNTRMGRDCWDERVKHHEENILPGVRAKYGVKLA